MCVCCVDCKWSNISLWGDYKSTVHMTRWFVFFIAGVHQSTAWHSVGMISKQVPLFLHEKGRNKGVLLGIEKTIKTWWMLHLHLSPVTGKASR